MIMWWFRRKKKEGDLVKKGKLLDEELKWRIIDKIPKDPLLGLLVEKGAKLLALEKYEEAIKCFDEAIRIDPTDWIPWYNKGYTLLKWGKYSVSQNPVYAQLERQLGIPVVSVNPFDALDHIKDRDAWLEEEKKKIEEALLCFDKVLELNPNDADFFYKKGIILRRLGRFEEALKCFNDVIRIDPRHELAKENKKEILEILRQ